jgi:acetyl esterase/lipase
VQRRAGTAAAAFEAGLREGLGADYRSDVVAVGTVSITPPPRRMAWRPFHFDRTGVEVIRNLSYGERPVRNRLDIYRPAGTVPGARLPVVIYVHGGAWIIGNKEQQGRPMLLHLARCGWIGVTINYRLAPRDRWPAQIIDVKRAIAWVREDIAEYGGDPSFVAIAGSSAGGHLSALVALSAGDPAFQPGFETADTHVDACVPIYAPFDFTDRDQRRGRAALRRLLEKLVMTTSLRDDPDGWRVASPLWRIGEHAPPMFVIQGRLDVLVWREDTRAFVTELRTRATAPVVFVEVPGAQHAFEVFNSVRCREAVDAIARFLAAVESAARSASRQLM